LGEVTELKIRVAYKQPEPYIRLELNPLDRDSILIVKLDIEAATQLRDKLIEVLGK
jgi:hypothetical protein